MSEPAEMMRSRGWQAILIVIVCAMMLPLSIFDAGWAPRSGTLLFVSSLSLACGALIGSLQLARAVRWPIVAVAAFALATSNAGLLNISVEAARIRMTAWATDLLAARVVEDPGLVTFWATLLVWWAGYSAMHGIVNGGRAMEALLPTGMPLTINLIYTQLNLAYIVVLVFGAAILIVWTTESASQTRWAARRLDCPDLQLEWTGSGFLIAILACTLAISFAYLTSQTTVAWMSRAFDWPASQARQIASRFLGGARPIASDANLGSIGILPASRLMTDPPELLDQQVMWVWTDEPAPLPDQAPGLHANRPDWRGLTYATYTGRGWSNPPLASQPLSSTLAGNLTQRFEITAIHGDTLFAVNQPVSSDADLTALYRSGMDVVGLRGAQSTYTVVSRVAPASPDALRQSALSYSPEITPYLQLAATLPQRVRDLSAEITRGAATPYEKAVRIESFLRTYPYTLDLPPLPEGRDLVDYFIFDAPGGYCDYYASAMVVMLRTVGVPARLASGYARGTYDDGRNAYRVSGLDAHSWPEVYFEGIGWVEFEPTAGRPILERESETRPAAEAQVSAMQVRAAQSQRRRWTVLGWGAAGAALLSAAIAIILIRRERQLAALPVDDLVPLIYERFRKRGAKLGVDVHPGDTPDEFVRAFDQWVGRRATHHPRWQAQAQLVRRAAMHLGELYVQASYSPCKPGVQEARQALEAWRTLRFRTWLFKFQISKARSLA